MRTPFASGLVGASVAFLFVGLAARSWEVVLLALPPLTFLALGTLAPPPRPQVDAARVLSRDRLSVGAEVEVSVTVRNEGPALDLVELVDLVPPEVRIVRGTNHAVVSLPTDESFVMRYVAKPVLKGEYRIGPLRVRALNPLGLDMEDAVTAPETTLAVAPAIESLAKARIGPRRTRPWFGHVTSRQIGPGVEFWGIRDYRPGDDVRRINWKASARLDILLSNEYVGERSGDVVIVLDARREAAVGTAETNAVEIGVRAALGVAEFVLASKNRVGLIVQRDVLDWVPPAFGRRQLYRILDHLIHVRAGGEWPFTFVSWVLSRYFPRDALVVLISPLTDRTALEAVTNLVAQGYDVTVVSPSPLLIEHAILAPSPAEALAFRILARERANLVAQLRRVAQVVDWDPTIPLALPLRRLSLRPARS